MEAQRLLRTNAALTLLHVFRRQVVRHAGGGGRPGKRPTFNWKQKKILGLDKIPEKTFEEIVRPTGNFSDIERFFNPEAGDRMVDLTTLEDFEPEKIQQDKYNDKKKVNTSMLYGSAKASGMLKRPKKERFQFRFSKKTSTDSYESEVVLASI
jgi:hypothetical protein